MSPLALDQRCRHALYQCIKCLLAGAFIQVQNLKVIITKINDSSAADKSLNLS